MTILYFDCFSGASGDMILGALIDAGVPAVAVERTISKLPIEKVGFRNGRTLRGGIDATDIQIDIPDDVLHRSYRDIVQMIHAADLPERVRDRALDTFEILAVAESKIHGVTKDRVHFHEVGALDTIADVVGAAVAIEHFAPDSIVASAIPIGSGTVESAHGTIPVPAPAVTEILTGVPLVPGGEGEVITPTGAAILKAACDRFGDPPPMVLRASGYGAGSRDMSVPNVLRVMVGDAIEHQGSGQLLLETNIDDMNPELIPYVIEVLIREGAADAWSTPIVMKKGRPALKLSALVDGSTKERVLDAFYRETTTLGVRSVPIEKDELLREWVEIKLDGHPIRIKIARRGTDVVTVAPEYEDAAKVARATGLPLKEVYARSTLAARTSLKL
jgi:uncharacterized protein (TIGR00299 family) protein